MLLILLLLQLGGMPSKTEMLGVTQRCHRRGKNRALGGNVLDTSAGSHVVQTFSVFRKTTFPWLWTELPVVPPGVPAAPPPVQPLLPGHISAGRRLRAG